MKRFVEVLATLAFAVVVMFASYEFGRVAGSKEQLLTTSVQLNQITEEERVITHVWVNDAGQMEMLHRPRPFYFPDDSEKVKEEARKKEELRERLRRALTRGKENH